jgi:hypothetical protein
VALTGRGNCQAGQPLGRNAYRLLPPEHRGLRFEQRRGSSMGRLLLERTHSKVANVPCCLTCGEGYRELPLPRRSLLMPGGHPAAIRRGWAACGVRCAKRSANARPLDAGELLGKAV